MPGRYGTKAMSPLSSIKRRLQRSSLIDSMFRLISSRPDARAHLNPLKRNTSRIVIATAKIFPIFTSHVNRQPIQCPEYVPVSYSSLLWFKIYLFSKFMKSTVNFLS